MNFPCYGIAFHHILLFFKCHFDVTLDILTLNFLLEWKFFLLPLKNFSPFICHDFIAFLFFLMLVVTVTVLAKNYNIFVLISLSILSNYSTYRQDFFIQGLLSTHNPAFLNLTCLVLFSPWINWNWKNFSSGNSLRVKRHGPWNKKKIEWQNFKIFSLLFYYKIISFPLFLLFFYVRMKVCILNFHLFWEEKFSFHIFCNTIYLCSWHIEKQ